jgi:hypothetical protein
MITKISGSKYNFEIYAEAKRKNCSFFIKAKSNSTGRFSCINNLNPVLSELHVNVNDPKFYDSKWVVTKDEIIYLEIVAQRILTDKSFLNYLERKLDEDRRLDEWVNISKLL